ncbi:tetratricopeptide repeat protein 17 isoform X2 [Lycorma delicatula]|uniref:tetratricopeptide repeat protein 17 isoform X2 n=1 Tax=Lycorma delicatula TaxID=130591 RepID=UPI003F5148DB
MKSWKVFAVLFKIFLGISASTHWVVTENGRIQSQLDSVFHLRHPYDLLSFLEQEKRLEKIESLYGEMLRRKAVIEAEWASLESTSMLKARVYKSDFDCLNAGLPLSDVDLYVSIGDDAIDREGINIDELIPSSEVIPETVPDAPDCLHYAPVNFSMHMFPHIQVLSQPWNLSSVVELSVELESLSKYSGKQIAAGLERNNTSWFLYNLATLYWAVQGHTQNAVNCAKFAMHFSPRRYRDVPLLNLGCLLQRAHCPAEAAILLHAAVDHAPHRPLSHYALATVYAVLGDYNRSVACYDNALRLRPDWTTAQKIRSTVLCHHKLESALYSLQRSLQDILTQLRDYYNYHKQWLKLQEELSLHQAPLHVKLHSLQHASFSTLLSHRGRKCMPLLQDTGGTVLTCDARTDVSQMSNNLVIDINLSLQLLLKNVESQAQMINEHLPHPLKETRLGLLKVPPPISEQQEIDEEESSLEIFIDNSVQSAGTGDSSTINVETELFTNMQHADDKLDSQGKKLIANNDKEATVNLDKEILQIETKLKDITGSYINQEYIPFLEEYRQVVNSCPRIELEDKRQLLTTLGLADDGSWLETTTPHLLTSLVSAWMQLGQYTNDTPPQTGSNDDVLQCKNYYSSVTVPQLTVDLLVKTVGGDLSPEPRLKSLLSQLFSDRVSRLPDIASHIARALQEVPSWTIATVAALYWRLLGNATQTVACVQLAVNMAPTNSKDSPLHNIALLMFRLGHHKEALLLGSLALQVAPHSFLAHLSLYTFYNAMGNNEKAVIFGRASIALQTLNNIAKP